MLVHPIKVAYVLAHFPSLNQTFIMNEMYWIRQCGVDITIFSLFDPRPEPVHDRAQVLLPAAHYPPVLAWQVVQAQLHFLLRAPGRYWRALGKVLRYSYQEPKLLVQALAVFPKSVFFAQQAQALGIEHIHAHFLLLGSIAASVMAELLNIPLTVHPHAVDLFRRNQSALRRQMEDAARVVTISTYNRDYIASLSPRLEPKAIEVVYCGVEIDRFQQSADLAHGGPLRIFSVGRLVEKKGHEYLVDACALLAQQGVPFHCQIVGTGPRQQALQARIAQHGLQAAVTLLGAVEQAQVIELCQGSDVFVLACVTANDGDQDGIPVSLMEAMACELPVVTTPVAGIPELVRDRETGRLVRERDAQNLATALAELANDAALRRQLGHQARQHVLEQFEIRRNVAKLAAIFQQVAGEPQAEFYLAPAEQR